MKKIIWVMVLILVVVYAVLAVLGAGGEYAAERLFYKAAKANSIIAANPDVVPPKLLLDVENNLKKILSKYPKTKVAITANVTLAEFYIHNKRYDDALSTLGFIIKTYDKSPAILSTAHFLKGLAYEKQDQWPRALKEYGILRDGYTNTELGMQAPLYIAKYYANKGKDADAAQAYNDAAAFYINIEKNNQKKMLGYIASTLLIQTYMSLENYEKAGVVIEETLDKYPSQMTLIQLLPQLENIFVKKLNRPEKAISIYKKIKENVKNEKLNEFLNKKIDALMHKKVS